MEPHGTYTIDLLGRVLMVDAKGPFNDDAVRDYSRDLAAFMERLAPDPWVLCAVFRNESLFTPEAEAELLAVTRMRVKKGMDAVAVVFKDIKCTRIAQDQLERIYQTADIRHAFFHEKQDALSWLSRQGYPSG